MKNKDLYLGDLTVDQIKIKLEENGFLDPNLQDILDFSIKEGYARTNKEGNYELTDKGKSFYLKKHNEEQFDKIVKENPNMLVIDDDSETDLEILEIYTKH